MIEKKQIRDIIMKSCALRYVISPILYSRFTVQMKHYIHLSWKWQH